MVLLASVLAFCGCINDSESPCDVENVREVTMNFRLAIQREAAKKTRAVIEGHEPGTAAENAVDLQSLKLLLLTQGGVILQDISDIAKKQNDPEADNYSSYIIKATFKEPYFDYSALGGDVKFNIMVLANWPQDALNMVAEKISALEIENAHPLYVMPAGGQGLVPSVSEDGSVGTGIPMYGFKDFTVSQSALLESTEAEPYDLKDDINLLRSVAKLEVADDISGKDAAGFPRVTSVSVNTSSYNSSALLIPENFRDNEQVTVPSIPSDPAPTSEALLLQTSSGSKAYYGYCYLPETSTGLSLTVEIENYAQGGSSHYVGEPQKASYTVRLTPDQKVWGDYFLRNHIYRLNIKSAGSALTLSYMVCPWDEQESGDISFD